MQDTFDGDPWVQTGFLGLLVAGLVFCLGGFVLNNFTSHHTAATGALVTGILFWVLALLLIGFVFLDPSPDE
jgi:hypothetical protein